MEALSYSLTISTRLIRPLFVIIPFKNKIDMSFASPATFRISELIYILLSVILSLFPDSYFCVDDSMNSGEGSKEGNFNEFFSFFRKEIRNVREM